MSTYRGRCVSNFFKVKDLEKFKEWIGKFPELETFEGENQEYIAFGSITTGIPEYMPTDDDEGSIQVEFITDLYKYLQEGEVAIVQEIGSEKLKLLIGFSVAIDWQGNAKYFSISDVHEWANNKYGRDILRCD